MEPNSPRPPLGCPGTQWSGGVLGETDRWSTRAAADLFAARLRDVSVLRGGTDGWHRRGLTLE
jgi:hypothetical protein